MRSSSNEKGFNQNNFAFMRVIIKKMLSPPLLVSKHSRREISSSYWVWQGNSSRYHRQSMKGAEQRIQGVHRQWKQNWSQDVSLRDKEDIRKASFVCTAKPHFTIDSVYRYGKKTFVLLRYFRHLCFCFGVWFWGVFLCLKSPFNATMQRRSCAAFWEICGPLCFHFTSFHISIQFL